MKTISLKDFTDNFMEISSNLTHAEIRLLYLFITEPKVIKLSQKRIADKIGTHRRTIIIGIKKLVLHEYISDINITGNQVDGGDKKNTASKAEKIDNVKEMAGKKLINRVKLSNALDEQKFRLLLQNIELEPDSDSLVQLFDNYPERLYEILIFIRDNLPENIDSLAKKYGFVDELEILRISNNILEILEKDKHFNFMGTLDLVDKYIKNYNNDRKQPAMKIVRQALVFYPFMFKENFLDSVAAYQFSDFDELVQQILKEIYEDEKLIRIITKSI